MFKSVGNFENRLTAYSFWQYICIVCIWKFRQEESNIFKYMPAYNNNKPLQSWINFFDLAEWTTNLFEHKHLNRFKSINAILVENEQLLEEYFKAELHPVSSWNSYWNTAAKYAERLQINDPVFKEGCTKYFGLHINCGEEEECFCEHNCGGTHTTEGRVVSSLEQTARQFPTMSDIEWAAVSNTTPSWTRNQQRKLDKGKDIDWD